MDGTLKNLPGQHLLASSQVNYPLSAAAVASSKFPHTSTTAYHKLIVPSTVADMNMKVVC